MEDPHFILQMLVHRLRFSMSALCSLVLVVAGLGVFPSRLQLGQQR